MTKFTGGLFSILLGYWIWQLAFPIANVTDDPKQKKNISLKWNDSLFKHLPKNIDTSIIIYDLNHTPLKFYQYVKPVFNHEAIIVQDRGEWKLHRLTEKSHDSLVKDDYAIASHEKRAAYAAKDTIMSWKIKLNKIAEALDRADYVLVLKSKRKLQLLKKGKIIKSFSINLGRTPVGNKVFSGDGKTPEGIYHLDDKWNREDEFYKSIKLSYPNFKDREIAQRRGVKPGYGILIHGTKANRKNAKDWTAGCIALQNNDMDTLFKYVGEGTLIEVRK